MKISVKLGVSQNTENHTFTLDELGITKLEWDLLNEQGKTDIIQESTFDLPNQPYWMIDSFEEL